MLFYCSSGDLTSIFLPDCRRYPPEGTGHSTGMEHLDGSNAYLHYQGIHTPVKGLKPYHLFSNKRVRISGTHDDAVPPVAVSLTDLARLPQLNGSDWNLDAPHPTHPRSTVTLEEVTGVSTSYDTRFRPFEFPNNPDPVHDHVTVEFNAPVTVEVFGVEKFTLSDEKDAYIYNFDDETPDVGQLNSRRDSDIKEIIDHDFKWVYSLIRPRDGRSRREFTGGRLEAPFSVIDKPTMKSIFVSTCFPAVMND
jgi:hypothetical protein